MDLYVCMFYDSTHIILSIYYIPACQGTSLCGRILCGESGGSTSEDSRGSALGVLLSVSNEAEHALNSTQLKRHIDELHIYT